MLQFKNVIPHPLKENFQSATDIWQTNVSFKKGENSLIAAPSGKGKSTFLHILYGLRTDYDGDVLINNKNIRDFKLNDWATIRQSELSIVFQNLRLFPQLTGIENIQVNNRLQQTKTLDQIQKMANRLGVEPILNQKAQTMSYGQRQRIAIIRALCQPFSFLLLDEPFSHLDEENIRLACELIKEEVTVQGASILLVSLGERYLFDYKKELIL